VIWRRDTFFDSVKCSCRSRDLRRDVGIRACLSAKAEAKAPASLETQPSLTLPLCGFIPVRPIETFDGMIRGSRKLERVPTFPTSRRAHHDLVAIVLACDLVVRDVHVWS